jgi:DNA-binding response OmpR family regulator
MTQNSDRFFAGAMAIKVLIVDDDTNLMVSRDFSLRREGYEVHVACDGQEAMDTLAKLHLALGANAYMIQPFSTQALTHKVTQMLQGAA